MRAGKMRHRVQILRPDTGTRNDYGEVVPTDAVVATVWADVKPTKEIERTAAQSQVAAQRTYTVSMRFTDVRVTDKLLHEDRLGTHTLNITSILLSEYENELALTCEENV